MPESAHTPGPWHAAPFGDPRRMTPILTDADGGLIGYVGAVGLPNRANAVLMAAAPDLIAACLALDELDMVEGYSINEGDYPKLWRALGLARDAIKKATAPDPEV